MIVLDGKGSDWFGMSGLRPNGLLISDGDGDQGFVETEQSTILVKGIDGET